MRKIWTIQELLKEMVDYFRKLEFLNARLEVELLLADILNKDRLWLYLHPDQPLTSKELALFKKSIIRRYYREPVQYIIGHWGFWTLDLELTPDVLIPRPETETLIEAVIRVKQRSARIIDIGTGSGNIVIALARELKDAHFWAVDISQKALAVAKENASRYEVLHKIDFLLGNLFEPLEGIVTPHSIDLIVSNPPYIPSADIDHLQPEISRFEPRLALDGGKDGLDFYRKIIHSAPYFLKNGGQLVMEFGEGQSNSIIEMMRHQGSYDKWKCVKDYNKKDRVIIIKKGDTHCGEDLYSGG
ncbi:MAG: peptide chain release factor N(5)-glutamine methyltransferase [bacterium]